MAKRTLLVMAMVAVVAAGVVWAALGDRLNSFGAAGQECYPNDTCDVGLTCWQIRSYHQCETEVRPVMREGTPYCYLFKSNTDSQEESRCFETENECLQSFANLMKSDSTVVQGCHF